MTTALEESPVVEPVSFAALLNGNQLLEAVTKLGLTVPTGVQAATLPEALADKDLIVQAQTGSGKTLAYVLPPLIKLQSLPENSGTFGLIIAPTRELASQVTEVIISLTSEVKPVCLIGGASSREQMEELGEDRRVIVGTPGRILDFIRQRKIVLRKCGYFVLDEADEMLSMGFLEDVRSILSRLPDKRQGLFISATITPRVQMLAQSFLKRPTTIVIESSTESAPEIEHLYCEVGSDLTDKVTALCDIIETQRPRAAIIFCNTKSDTELVEVYLRRRGFEARRINSDLSQGQRDRIMAALRAGELPLLIATDVAARGIDIEELSLVINYSIHREPETYVHRTGRTGRAGRKGCAISLVSPFDFSAFYGLRKTVSIDIKKMELPTETEVNDARLAHFYEIVRESKVELTDKERGIARHILKDLGDIESPSEEMTDMLAKLYGLAMRSISLQSAAKAPIDESEGVSQDVPREQDTRPRQQYRGNRSRNDRDRNYSGRDRRR